jgi:hypothetical protein
MFDLENELAAALSRGAAGDAAAAATAALITCKIDHSEQGQAKARTLLLQAFQSEDADLLIEIASALFCGHGLFIDEELAMRFVHRARALSWKGNYFLGAILFRKHDLRWKDEVRLTARRGHIASQSLLNNITYVTGFKPLDFLIRLWLSTVVALRASRALEMPDRDERLWRVFDQMRPTNPPDAFRRTLGTDRKRLLTEAFSKVGLGDVVYPQHMSEVMKELRQKPPTKAR